MISVQLGHHHYHLTGCCSHSSAVPRSVRSLTSLQTWQLTRPPTPIARPRQKLRVCSSKRGSESFFKDDFFKDGRDSLNEAKRLFAQSEKMFQKGQFQQGQRLIKQAEQQLRQAGQKTPIQPFKSSNMDFRVPKIDFGGTDPSWKASTLAVLGVGAIATLVAGPIIATFLALAVGIGAVVSTSLAIVSVAWIIPAVAIFLSLGGLFVFPVVLTLGLTATGLGIGAAAVAAFKNFIPKQTVRTYPEAAEAAEAPEPETEEQRQRRQYEEESEKLANELREFDAQLEVKEKDAYRDKLKKEGLWKD